MREWTIGISDDGRRVDRAVEKELSGAPRALLQRAFRNKDIKRNGKPARPDDRCAAGDVLRAYIHDEVIATFRAEDKLLSRFRPHINVAYEDEQILLVDKPTGLVCHPDENEKVDTLLTHIRAYLYQKDALGNDEVALCNRIDRFTSGLVIAARTKEARVAMDERIRAREVRKTYLCVIEGEMRPGEGAMDNYLYKAPGAKRVEVYPRQAPGAQRAVTYYRTLLTGGGRSLLECELETGRTHQIRAQLAFARHPIAGDAQYGRAEAGGRGCQCLCAYRVFFDFEDADGPLRGVAGRVFSARRAPFIDDFFPGARIP